MGSSAIVLAWGRIEFCDHFSRMIGLGGRNGGCRAGLGRIPLGGNLVEKGGSKPREKDCGGCSNEFADAHQVCVVEREGAGDMPSL